MKLDGKVVKCSTKRSEIKFQFFKVDCFQWFFLEFKFVVSPSSCFMMLIWICLEKPRLKRGKSHNVWISNYRFPVYCIFFRVISLIMFCELFLHRLPKWSIWSITLWKDKSSIHNLFEPFRCKPWVLYLRRVVGMGHLKKADARMTDFASAWLTDGSVGLIAVFYGYLNLASSELMMGFKNFIKLVCPRAQKNLAPRFQAAKAQYQAMNGINGINGNFGSAATWMEKIAVRTGRTDIQTKNQFDECPLQNNVPYEHGIFNVFQVAHIHFVVWYGIVKRSPIHNFLMKAWVNHRQPKTFSKKISWFSSPISKGQTVGPVSWIT